LISLAFGAFGWPSLDERARSALRASPFREANFLGIWGEFFDVWEGILAKKRINRKGWKVLNREEGVWMGVFANYERGGRINFLIFLSYEMDDLSYRR
jgi:hypothetical protein